MGIYVNPADQSKETWLKHNAREVKYEWLLTNFQFGQGELPVCHVNNGPFTAAGVAFSPDEMRYFACDDERPRTWYVASVEKLKTVTPETYHRMME